MVISALTYCLTGYNFLHKLKAKEEDDKKRKVHMISLNVP